jgi:hypothetical protein
MSLLLLIAGETFSDDRRVECQGSQSSRGRVGLRSSKLEIKAWNDVDMQYYIHYPIRCLEKGTLLCCKQSHNLAFCPLSHSVDMLWKDASTKIFVTCQQKVLLNTIP